VIDILSELGYW